MNLDWNLIVNIAAGIGLASGVGIVISIIFLIVVAIFRRD